MYYNKHTKKLPRKPACRSQAENMQTVVKPSQENITLKRGGRRPAGNQTDASPLSDGRGRVRVVLWRRGQEFPKLERKTFKFVVGTSDALYNCVEEGKESESGMKNVSVGHSVYVYTHAHTHTHATSHTHTHTQKRRASGLTLLLVSGGTQFYIVGLRDHWTSPGRNAIYQSSAPKL